MSSPSPSKSFRSRMGGVMRRTSSVLAMANSRPSTPTPATTPTPAGSQDEGRRSSISKSVEGRMSTSSLTPSGATPPPPVAPPEPAPQLPPVAVDAPLVSGSEPVSEPVSEPTTEPEPAPTSSAPETEAAPPVIIEESAPAAAAPEPAPAPQPTESGIHKAVKRLLPIAAQYQMYPSPIAESPAREAEEVERDRLNAPPPNADAPPPSDLAEEVHIPSEPMLKDHGANPGAFTDEPMDMDPAELPAPVSEAEPVPVPDVIVVHEPVALPEPVVAIPDDPVPTEPIGIPAAQRAPAIDDPSYFDLVHVAEAVQETSPGSDTVVGAGEHLNARVSPYPYGLQPEPQPAPLPEPAAAPASIPSEADSETGMPEPAVMPEPQPEPVPEPQPQFEPQPEPQPYVPDVAPATPEPRMWETEGGGGWVTDAMVMPAADKLTRLDFSDAHANEDPFVDPPHAIGRTESGDSGVFIPIPIVMVDRDQREDEVVGYDAGGISSIPMPVPANDRGLALPLGSIRSIASTENPPFQPTDERRPLLARPSSPGPDSYHQPSHTHEPGNYRAVDAGTEDASFHDLGWIAYVLPDVSATYYVHPTLRATTDADLRDAQVLNHVSRGLGHSRENVNGGRSVAGLELWLRRIEGKGGKHVRWRNGAPGGSVNGKGKGNGHANGHGNAKGKGKGKSRGSLEEVGLTRWWVDHAKREVSAAEDVVGLEDHLDMEYRYWAFMESHPAHASLPFAARREAMDVLTWAWTDRVLPPQQLPLPPPFTQNECQELSGLLRSFGETAQTESGIQSIVVTRIVARILLRVAHWRQYHFRPHKPLPLERTGNHHLRNFPRPPGFMRRVADVLLSCLLLGVPYLFYTRGGYHRGDAEAGAASARSLLPILLIGACTCLLAAVLLSASVTFLSLPGLDSIARAVVLAVVLLAAGAMASGLVALFRYKAELVDAAAPMNTVMVGGEGMMIISTRSVVMSLPLVLLIYAVLGFVAAVVLYSFLGVNASAVRFEDYTRWAVLGVLGGLAGVLTMSVVLLR